MRGIFPEGAEGCQPSLLGVKNILRRATFKKKRGIVPRTVNVQSSTSHRKVHPLYEQLGWFRVHDLTNERPRGLFPTRQGHGRGRQSLGTVHRRRSPGL